MPAESATPVTLILLRLDQADILLWPSHHTFD